MLQVRAPAGVAHPSPGPRSDGRWRFRVYAAAPDTAPAVASSCKEAVYDHPQLDCSAGAPEQQTRGLTAVLRCQHQLLLRTVAMLRSSSEERVC